MVDAYIADEKIFNDNSKRGPASANFMRIRAVAELLAQCQESRELEIRSDFVVCMLDAVIQGVLKGPGPENLAQWRTLGRMDASQPAYVKVLRTLSHGVNRGSLSPTNAKNSP